MSKPKVLIVEDEFLIRLTLTESLSEEGFEIIAAASGQEALDALAAHPEVVLLVSDLQLPGDLDGRAVARATRTRTPDLPVIYMTGRSDAPDGVVASPRDAFLTKPYLPSELCALARRLAKL
jgi:CheY-like chemotaxis protein